MPFFRPVESAARNLRPLSDHRLVVAPLLAPPVAGPPTLRSRVSGRSHSLLGGVAVLAVAGALSASLAGSTHASAMAGQANATAGFASLLAPAAYGAPAAAAAPAALVKQPASATTAKAHSPSLQLNPHTPQGAAVVTHQDTVHVKAMSSALRKLRTCETGGNYREASGNGYYGAYQFDLSTWHSLGLTGLPSNASHQLQDVAVVRLETARGWGPWPVCSYVAGLR